MRILCATDFSQQGSRAVQVAAKLAKRFGDNLVLAHALEPWVAYSVDPNMEAARLETARQEWANAELAKLADSLRKTGVVVQVQVVAGMAEQVIAGLADSDTRFVVLGSHGHKAPWRWFVGSVTERVAQRSAVPVLVVRDDPSDLLQWLEGNRPLRVVVGIDQTRASDAALAWLRSLRSQTAVDINFVSFYWPPEQLSRLGLRGARNLFDDDAEIVMALQRELREKIADLPGEGKVELSIKANWGRVGDIIALAAEEAAADLILVGNHQRRGVQKFAHESVSRELLHCTSLPVLCVPMNMAKFDPKALPELQQVLVATDLSEFSQRTVNHACVLAKSIGGCLDIVHVLENKAVDPRYDKSATGVSVKERAALEKRLNALVPEHMRTFPLRVHVVDGQDVSESILQMSERIGADLICIGSHGQSGLGKSFLGSVAKKLIEKSSRPVYVVRSAID